MVKLQELKTLSGDDLSQLLEEYINEFTESLMDQDHEDKASITLKISLQYEPKNDAVKITPTISLSPPPEIVCNAKIARDGTFVTTDSDQQDLFQFEFA